MVLDEMREKFRGRIIWPYGVVNGLPRLQVKAQIFVGESKMSLTLELLKTNSHKVKTQITLEI